jgi:pyruvate carboxylase
MSGMRLIEQRITAHAEPPRLSRSVADPSDPLHGAVPMPGSIVTVAHRGPTLPTW